mmetsp:Transcript_22135/g.40698  ORF Transcript_22135/g.40698 Transcript_22135/m.40698 type:complete len:625 (+) Transcript_22135:67-1941(+)
MFGVDEGVADGEVCTQAPVWPEDVDFLKRNSPKIVEPEDEVVVILQTLGGEQLACSGRSWRSGACVKDVRVVLEDGRAGLKADLFLLPDYATMNDTSMTLLQLLSDQSAATRELQFAVAFIADGPTPSSGSDPAPESPPVPVEKHQPWVELQQEAIRRLRGGSSRCRPQLPELHRMPLERELRMQGGGYVVPGNVCDGLKCIGAGAFGRVIKIERQGKAYAMKRQPLGYFDETSIPLLREVAILNALKGARNVVQLIDAFLARPNQIAEVWTVLELFPGDLHDELCKCEKDAMAEALVNELVYQILLGLQSLHVRDIVHRDLKPENVLVNWNPTLQVALCDFGVSRSVHGWNAASSSFDLAAVPPDPPGPPELQRHFTVTVGTSCWKAPEMWGLADLSGMVKKDLMSIDIFALGLVWAQMLAGRRVLEYSDEFEPDFMLLEILKKVDHPDLERCEWEHLGFQDRVIDFCQAVKDGDTHTVQCSLGSTADADRKSIHEQILQSPARSIAQWITDERTCQYSTAPPCSEESLHLITQATRLNYRTRPTVAGLRGASCFSLLRTVSNQEEAEPCAALWDTEEVISQNVNRHSQIVPPVLSLERSVSNDVRQVAQKIQMGLAEANNAP